MATSGDAFVRAQQFYEQGQLDLAIPLFQQAIDDNPADAAAHLLLGKSFMRTGHLAQAQDALERAVRFQPELAEAHLRLGEAQEGQSLWNAAAATYRRFLEVRPRHTDALNRLGILMARRQSYDEAVSLFQTVLEIDPKRAGAHHNVAVALADQDRPAEALPYFDESLRLDPKHTEAHKGKGMALLKLGDFAAGWPEYEWRFLCKDLAPLETSRPQWDGGSLAGKTILLHTEQGIGDSFQFIRFAPQVKARGGTVILACLAELFPLMGTCQGIDQLADRKGPFPEHDVHAPLLSLPGIFGTQLATIPAQVPYLEADAGRIDIWRRELAATTSFKIGIVWQGNPKNANDANRSMPLGHFEVLAKVPGVQLFSLQKGPGYEQLAHQAKRPWVVDLGRRMDGAFLDAAAAMKSLDLVICCDTGMGHLAGALAVPVWLAVHRSSDWRWLQQRRDTPWYPTMRIFRQQRSGDWPGVFRQMAEQLREKLALRSGNGANLHNGNGANLHTQSPRPQQQPTQDAPVNSSRGLYSFGGCLNPDVGANSSENRLEQAIVPADALSIEELFQLALAEQMQDKLAEAAENFRRLLARHPEHVESLTNLGVVMGRLGREREGETYLRQAIRIRPAHAKAHYNLGVTLAAMGKHAQALDCFQETIRLDPRYAEGHYSLAVSLAGCKRDAEAAEHYEQALQISPDFAEAYNNLGLLRFDQGKPADAVILLEQAVRLKPDYIGALTNLGLAQASLGRHEEALLSFREALRQKPMDAEMHNNLGTVLSALGRAEEASACYRQSLRIRPGHPEAHWHQALNWLQQGDMERGWPEYEWRWKRQRARPRSFKEPAWDGSSLEGKSILLWCEQGLGDSIQFIRYAPMVKARGGTVFVECPAPLLPLFSTCQGIDQLVAERTDLPAFDVQLPLLSLPGIFKTTLDTVPNEVPYVKADPVRVETWRQEIGSGHKLKIGVIWQGNPKHIWDRHRSFRPDLFHGLSQMPGVQLYSLQKGAIAPGADLARRCPMIDLTCRINDFADTAGLLSCLDLIVTCDSSPAHLAGALGLPVWVAMSVLSDWRWLNRREDSPWYPTMRLFRQKRLGDWDEVFDRIEHEAKRLVSSKSCDHGLSSGGRSLCD